MHSTTRPCPAVPAERPRSEGCPEDSSAAPQGAHHGAERCPGPAADNPGGDDPPSPPEAEGGPADGRRDLLIALHADPELGRATACRLGQDLERWADPDRPRIAAGRLGVPAADLERARRLRPRAADLAAAERRRAAAAGGRLVTRLDAEYPRSLLDLPLPPPVLAVAGAIPEEVTTDGLAVSMVGSRRADAYGLEVAAELARALATLGLPVISGFARGVDTAAHRGALDGGGSTVAVLGCGLDVDYPRGHRGLFRRIASGGGAVLSEFPCGAGPKRWHFPVRNRLIAALSLGTVVVRAAARSGSLITARLALDLGREVLAVPGPIFDRLSAGPNRLLEDGAALAASAPGVLEALVGPSGALGLLRRAAERRAAEAHGEGGGELGAGAESDGEGEGGEAGAEGLETIGRPERGLSARVLEALPVGRERSPEAVAVELEVGVDAVLAVLLELELGGWVRRLPGPAYARRAGRPEGTA